MPSLGLTVPLKPFRYLAPGRQLYWPHP